MIDDERFKEAIRRFDDANARDPRMETVDGAPQPRELLFSRRVSAWIEQLVETPSEALLLAARSHTIQRWMIPRDRYPRNNAGYHEWRNALAKYHADEAASILADVGYPQETIDRVRDFALKTHWPSDEEACALEDADCLVFLATKLHNYLDEWDDDKAIHILQLTYRKMTPKAQACAKTLNLGGRANELLRRALG